MSLGRYLAAVWALVFLIASAASAVDAPVLENLTEVKVGVKIPTTVILDKFNAYDTNLAKLHPEQGKTALTPFQGKVSVPLQVYLSAVVLGEIDIASIIGTTYYVAGQVTPAQREAFHAQAQAALNCLLYRMANQEFRAGTNPIVKVEGDTVTVSGENPGPGKTSFQTTALPIRFSGFNISATGCSLDFGDFMTSTIFSANDPVFNIVSSVLGEYNYPKGASLVNVVTLGDKVPVDLPYFDKTSYGMTSDVNVTTGGGWSVHLRAQPSPEYLWSGVYGGMVYGDANTDQVGMSQKGMIAMAAEGLSSTQILDHYYHYLPPFVQSVEVLQVNGTLENKLIARKDDAKALQTLFSRIEMRGLVICDDDTNMEVMKT